MSVLCVADATALHRMSQIVDKSDHPEMLDKLTRSVDRGHLGFPREVADELQVIARDQPIWAWACGLTNKLDIYSTDIALLRPLMGHIRDAGFDHGIDSLDGKEGALADVGRLCLSLDEDGTEFVLATEDSGEVPLRPTMAQVAFQAGWALIDAPTALRHLNLGHLLV